MTFSKQCKRCGEIFVVDAPSMSDGVARMNWIYAQHRAQHPTLLQGTRRLFQHIREWFPISPLVNLSTTKEEG